MRTIWITILVLMLLSAVGCSVAAPSIPFLARSPTPALAPTLANTVAPTSAATETSEPIATETAAPTSTESTAPTTNESTPPPPAQAPTESASPTPLSQANSNTSGATVTPQRTACDNGFHPLSSTGQWNYRLTFPTAGSPQTTYTMTITGITPVSFTEHRVFADAQADTQWTCKSDGLLATQLVNLATAGRSQFMVETLESAGITLPPEEQWTVGYAWSSHYRIRGQLTNTTSPVTGEGTADSQDRIVAQEQVTVPAGTFDTFRVDSTTTLNLTASFGFLGVPTTLTVSESSWYARDMGLVKSTVTFQGQTATTELTSGP